MHEAILSKEIWERVQQRLNQNSRTTVATHQTDRLQSRLAGKLFDADGQPGGRAGATKGQADAYRY